MLLQQPTQTLKDSSLGVVSVAALGCVMMAPALGIHANLGIISANSGPIAPAVFLAALVCTLPPAVYATVTKRTARMAALSATSERTQG